MRGKGKRGDPWAAARQRALAAGARPVVPALSVADLVARAQAADGAAGAASDRPRAGGPSKLEERYRLEVLEPARVLGQVVRYQHQPPAYTLAHRCTLTVDYLVVCADGATEAVDVKGRQVWEDSTIKLKFLATLHPDLRCVQAHRVAGGWRRRVIPPGQLEADDMHTIHLDLTTDEVRALLDASRLVPVDMRQADAGDQQAALKRAIDKLEARLRVTAWRAPATMPAGTPTDRAPDTLTDQGHALACWACGHPVHQGARCDALRDGSSCGCTRSSQRLPGVR